MVRLTMAAGVAALLLMPLVGHAQNPAPAAGAEPAPVGQPAPAAERVHVEGFRGAKWGMSEAEVKAVIASEFKIPADKLKPETNASEKTAVISITVPELIDRAGTARISYIFGYKTKKLIQVNILWGSPVDHQAKPEMVVAAANQLRQLFTEEGYDPATVITNARTADGGVVIFQGQDADKHTTVLRLMTAPAPGEKPAKGAAKEKSPPQTALFLSYVMDSANPDVYRLKKGQF